jgi:hypothetical protein
VLRRERVRDRTETTVKVISVRSLMVLVQGENWRII